MPTAAVSPEVVPPPTARSSSAIIDVEAALPLPATNTNTNDGRAEYAPAPGPVEVEAEQENVGGVSATARFLHQRRRMADFPFFALGFAAVVSLVFIISDLMNKHTFHPISAGVFLLSSSYCIAVIRREWSAGEGAEGDARAPGQPGVLTKEARESLLNYFVFQGAPATVEGAGGEAAAAGSAEGEADQPQPEKQEHGLEQGRAEGSKEPPGSGSARALEETSSSGGGTVEPCGGNDSRKNCGENEEATDISSCGGSRGGSMRDDRIVTDATNAGTDSLPASTPAASPGRSSPGPLDLVSLQQQPDLPEGDGGGDGGGGGGLASRTAPAAAVAGIDLGQLDGEDHGGGGRIEGPAPFDGMNIGLSLAVETSTSACAHATHTALSGGGGKAAPETPETPAEPVEGEEEAVAAAAATAPASTPVAGDMMKGASGPDTGEWSTDQSCIVCFGDYIAGDLLCRLPCRHVYHAKCIDEWLDRARLPCCPLCKTDLLASRSDDGDGNNSNNNGTVAADRGRGDGVTAAPAGLADVSLSGENSV